MTKKILIDCDPGVDDAMAIALAHGSPEVDVVGLTTVAGNVNVDKTTRNALSLVEFLGMDDVPVARGAERPLVREPVIAEHVHGDGGLGHATLPAPTTGAVDAHAVDFLIDTLAAARGEISVAAVGPLTNIALALRKEPKIAEWVREFVIMGGSYTRGNRTPAAEFNVLADPEAAAVVFSAPWETVMIGLDLTHQARANAVVRARFAELQLGRLDSELLTPCLDLYGQHAQYVHEGPAIHDACAVAYVIDPSLVTTVHARVDVETHGRFTSGMTVTDFAAAPGKCNVQVATELKHDEFWDLVADAYVRIAAAMA